MQNLQISSNRVDIATINDIKVRTGSAKVCVIENDKHQYFSKRWNKAPNGRVVRIMEQYYNDLYSWVKLEGEKLYLTCNIFLTPSANFSVNIR